MAGVNWKVASEPKMDARIVELMGRERESENLAKILFSSTIR